MSSMLTELFPEFSRELTSQLIQEGETALAQQVPVLRVVDHDRSQDAVAIHTAPRPRLGYGPTHRNVQLDLPDELVVLDVVAEKIVCIEVLPGSKLRAGLRGLEK